MDHILNRPALGAWAAALALVLAAGPVAAQEILSRDRAATLFAMSRDQWNANARAAEAAGAATARITGDGVARMEILYADGAMFYVLPEYPTSPEGPDRIQVTITYPPTMSRMLDAETIAAMTAENRAEMAPDYTVSVDYESVGGGVAIFFIIGRAE